MWIPSQQNYLKSTFEECVFHESAHKKRCLLLKNTLLQTAFFSYFAGWVPFVQNLILQTLDTSPARYARFPYCFFTDQSNPEILATQRNDEIFTIHHICKKRRNERWIRCYCFLHHKYKGKHK